MHVSETCIVCYNGVSCIPIFAHDQSSKSGKMLHCHYTPTSPAKKGLENVNKSNASILLSREHWEESKLNAYLFTQSHKHCHCFISNAHSWLCRVKGAHYVYTTMDKWQKPCIILQ